MLKLDPSRLSLAGIIALSLLVAGVISTQARNSRQDAPAVPGIARPVQTAPGPITTRYPSPVASYPVPVPSRYGDPPTRTPKPARPTATPYPWLRYVEVLTPEPKQ